MGRARPPSTRMAPVPDRRPARALLAFAIDLAVVVAFVLIGRRTHGEDAGFRGFVRVLWPFAVALVAGWAIAVLPLAPFAWRRAVPAWLTTVALGMALRIAVEGRALKVGFLVVATLFLGACILGWRAAVAGWRRISTAPPAIRRR